MVEIGFNDRFDNLIIGLANDQMWFLTKEKINSYRFASWVSDKRGFNFSIVFKPEFSLCAIHNSFKITIHKDILHSSGLKTELSQINIYNRSANLRSELEYYWFVQLYFLHKELFRC
jgi:hypothetical protein